MTLTALGIGLLMGIGVFCVWWSFIPPVQRRVRSDRPSRIQLLRETIARAGLEGLSPWALIGICVGLFLLVCLLTMILTLVPAVSIAFGLIAGGAPWVWVHSRARARQTQLRELWPDVVDSVTSAVRAGLSLPEALVQLEHRGPEELRPAFAAFARDYRVSGNFSQCLDRLKERLADPVADRLVEALRIAREVGGTDLGRLLRTLSGFLRDDARTRAELEARQSWTVNAARLALGAPWVVLALLSTQGDTLQAYRSPTGVMVLVGGAAISVVAYLLMLRLGRLPVEDRVLR